MATAKARPVSPRPSPSTSPRREYWRALIAECGRSGLSQTEFCRRRAIPPGTLSCWKSKLSEEARRRVRPAPSSPPRPSFLPVKIVARRPDDALPPAASTLGAGELEIALASGRLVRVRGRVDAHWLGQVIATLGLRRSHTQPRGGSASAGRFNRARIASETRRQSDITQQISDATRMSPSRISPRNRLSDNDFDTPFVNGRPRRATQGHPYRASVAT
jgi:hypothetical protein